MGRDQRRPRSPRVLERRLDPVVHGHELPAAHGYGMRRHVRVEVVVRELEAREHEQVVVPPCSLRLRGELGKVVGVVRGPDAARRRVGREPRIVAAVDVVGDAEHVEPVASVEVDELGHGQCAVAPPRVRVELAEQRLDLPAHPIAVSVHPGGAWAERW